MRKLCILGIFSVFIALSSWSFTAYAFNSAAHIYIAEHVFGSQNINLYYGSIAPDLSLYVGNPEKWPTAFQDTHYTYADLRPYAWDFTQRAFARGWLTHNEAWGADYYAHIVNPLSNNICITQGYYQGYVIEKACILSKQTGIDSEFAHYAIETAIDLLLRNNDDLKLGKKLLNANLFRSWEDRTLLVKVLVLKDKRTDLLTLATTELTFRNLENQYAIGLALPPTLNEEALAELGSKLAIEMYGIEISPQEVLKILEGAILLCKGDYKEVVNFAIDQIKNRI